MRLKALYLCGVLAIATGCPAKNACPPCYVGGVMADTGSTPNPAPNSAVHLQLDSSYSRERVSEVRVVLTDANGGAETLTYSGDKVKDINSKSLTTISDTELYSVGDNPPVDAQVDFVFSSGKTASAISIPVKPETPGSTGTSP
jgi:hypothetical protein